MSAGVCVLCGLSIVTNNVPRPVLEAYELSPAEREGFDYLDWAAIEAGRDSASFFRYRGELYDLGDGFESWAHRGAAAGELVPLLEWDGVRPDSFFSGLVIKWPRLEWGAGLDFESVIVGRYCC